MFTHLTRGLLAALALGSVVALAQPTSTSPLAPPPNGVRRLDPGAAVGEAGRFALVGATVHSAPGKTIENATILVRAGRIESVGPASAVPAGVQTRDAAGMHIYPGFVEPYLEVEVPAPDADAPGTHWNPNVTPQRTALDKGSRGVDDRTAQSLRELGFTAAAISPRGGIFRGSSSVVSLADVGKDPSGAPSRIYRDHAYQSVGLEAVRSGGGRGDDAAPDSARWSGYPNSQMGAIALIRQTFSDSDWQQGARRNGEFKDADNALDAMAKPQTVSSSTDAASVAPSRGWNGLFLFDVGDELETLRCAKIAAEFQRPAAILGSGQEYQRLDAVVATKLPLILPLMAPRPPQVGTIGEQNNAELAELMHWEQSPTNPRRVEASLREAGREMDVSFTTSKSADRGGGGRRGRPVVDTPESQLGAESSGAGGSRSSFADRLGNAIKHGLPADRALAMLTVNPARLLGLERELGTIEPGKVANLVIADGPLFTDRPDAPKKDEPGYVKAGRIIGVWIDGREHIIRSLPPIRIGGRYDLALDPPPPGSMKLSFDIDDSSSLDRPDLRITKVTPDEAHPDDTSKDKTVEITVTDLTVRNTTFRFSFEHEPFGEKGVFVNSGVIEKAADGTIILRAEGVRASGKAFTWTARRTGPAAPRKRSLAGSWPLLFDAPAANGGAPLLTFDQGNIPSIQPAPGLKQAAEGKPLKLDNFKYDGAKFSYDFDQSQMLDKDGKALEGVAHVEAAVDWSANPPRLSGTVTAPNDAGKASFTSIRRARNPFTGDWRITQADGIAHDLNSPDGLTITIKGGGTNSGPGTGGGGRRGRGRAAEGGGDGGASRGPTVTLTFTSKDKSPIVIEADQVEQRGGKLFFQHALEKLGVQGESRDELTIAWNKDDPNKDILIGLGRTPPPDEAVHAYQASRVIKPDEDKKETATIAAIPAKLTLPFGPYGVEQQPAPERILITNATIWTCKEGTTDTVITDGAVVISDGKISYVGPSAGIPRLTEGFITIDAAGKFVTPGIIDCHSHTGISRGVNESGQAVTAEVRIGDVTNPDDVSWYRQLAGGVTCVNNLHGSANAIGGQSMVNKIRWGCVQPDDMHFEADGSAAARGALPGIKFALGENPKQSNWGDRSVTRYPQTRMGVEMLIRDRFTAAKEYAAASNSASKPRRDLELEALAEILQGTRLVHCHSYRQDEILMLTRVARDFSFKIGTFQHILEGYKVADELVKYSGGASAFSDWWAYKIEVQDAIPTAGPLMAEQGVVVSFNSDSDEMARRLNVEAGKATKYSRNNKGGAIPTHEAYKFVTLNPAKQLHIDKFTGSLESGKDADIAIWSGVPTSPTSRCELTFVDGRRMFSLDLDTQQRERIKSERARLIQKALSAPDRGGRGGDDGADVAADYDADSDSEISNLKFEISLLQARASGRRLLLLEAQLAADDYIRDQNLDLIRRGLDPRWMRAGDCGCGF